MEKKITYASNTKNIDNSMVKKETNSSNYCVLNLNDKESSNINELVTEYYNTVNRLKTIRSKLYALHINPDQL
tara:strand:- start:3707 stop:3925 length:219 start_codon:yes stop_codon:yes gene_type:complete